MSINTVGSTSRYSINNSCYYHYQICFNVVYLHSEVNLLPVQTVSMFGSKATVLINANPAKESSDKPSDVVMGIDMLLHGRQ